MEKKTLGSFIALLRKEKGLTQRQLAELLNVSDKTVSHWECDENSPDISLLPFLAETLGVSVDELLRGERKAVEPTYSTPTISTASSEKSDGFATKAINKIRGRMSGDITERYRYFRILSLAGAIIPCVVIIIIAVTNLIAGYYFFDELSFIPGIVAFLGSLWILAISAGLTLGARLAFSKTMLPSAEADAEEKKHIYKANCVCFNNLYLIFCSLPMALTGYQEILGFAVILNILIAGICLSALWLVLILILNKKGILSTEKKKMLKLRYISIFAVSALIVSSSLILFREAYYPPLDKITFHSEAAFVAYMETPANKPDEAYLIDGVTASTFPPTMPAPGQDSQTDYFIDPTHNENDDDTVGESVIGIGNGKYVTFKWLNNNVCDIDYTDNGTFTVITYEAKIKQKNMWLLVDDGVPVVIFAFTIADALTCLFLYKKKINTLTEM